MPWGTALAGCTAWEERQAAASSRADADFTTPSMMVNNFKKSRENVRVRNDLIRHKTARPPRFSRQRFSSLSL